MYGLYILRRWVHRILLTQSFRHHVMRETFVVSTMVVGLCVLHLAEILAWTGGYLAIGALPDFSDAIYYSLTTYTTLGADGLSIGRNYRAVAGFESLLGPMMMAWSTASLVAYVTLVISATGPLAKVHSDERRDEEREAR
ncbi:ion channel [Xanthobacter sediminis]